MFRDRVTHSHGVNYFLNLAETEEYHRCREFIEYYHSCTVTVQICNCYSCNGHQRFALKMAKFDPLSETLEWTDWNITRTIDCVINLKNLAKFSFRNVLELRCIYSTYIRVCVFFPSFYANWHGYSLNGWTDFDAQYLKRSSLVRARPLIYEQNNGIMTLIFVR